MESRRSASCRNSRDAREEIVEGGSERGSERRPPLFLSRKITQVGEPNARDDIMDFARTNNYVVLTHDPDFGAILAVTHGDKPSVRWPAGGSCF